MQLVRKVLYAVAIWRVRGVHRHHRSHKEGSVGFARYAKTAPRRISRRGAFWSRKDFPAKAFLLRLIYLIALRLLRRYFAHSSVPMVWARYASAASRRFLLVGHYFDIDCLQRYDIRAR